MGSGSKSDPNKEAKKQLEKDIAKAQSDLQSSQDFLDEEQEALINQYDLRTQDLEEGFAGLLSSIQSRNNQLLNSGQGLINTQVNANQGLYSLLSLLSSQRVNSQSNALGIVNSGFNSLGSSGILNQQTLSSGANSVQQNLESAKAYSGRSSLARRRNNNSLLNTLRNTARIQGGESKRGQIQSQEQLTENRALGLRKFKDNALRRNQQQRLLRR